MKKIEVVPNLQQDDNLRFSNVEIPDVLRGLLEKTVWMSFLDVGCGDGSLLLPFSRKDFSIILLKSVWG